MTLSVPLAFSTCLHHHCQIWQLNGTTAGPIAQDLLDMTRVTAGVDRDIDEAGAGLGSFCHVTQLEHSHSGLEARLV